MGANLGDARRVRKLQRLFEVWRQAFERQNVEGMAAAKRAIDATITGHVDSAVTHQKK